MWIELTFDSSHRPNHPEDNTLVIKADSIKEAIEKHENNQGKTTIRGKIISSKVVYYVHDDWETKNE